MFITRKCLSRRTVLKGAGMALALPLLDAMIPAGSAVAQTTVAKPKIRMGFVYFPHGAVIRNWVPQQTGTDFEFSPILKPLAPYKPYVTIVSGLRNKGGESSDPHGIMAGTWLSCVGPKDRDGTGDRGVTADQLAARHIGQDTALPSLEVAGEGGGSACAAGVASCGFGSTTAFRTPTQSLPMETNPRKVFYQMFGQGDTSDERVALLEESGSVLDYVAQASAGLQRKLGDSDRTAVSDYLDSIREVERRVQKMSANSRSLANLPDAPLGIPEDFTELLDVHFEMIALAWQTDQTRIASFMIAKEVSMRTYNMVGVSDAFHPLSHHQNDPVKLERLTRIQSYHTERFAKFVKRLAGMKEPAGSVLDQSIVLFGSNMSNSDLHNNDPLPSVVLGKGGGSIKGGQHLHYPQDTPHANLLLTLLQRANVPVQTLGNSTGTFAEV
jgi:hypothetical protein